MPSWIGFLDNSGTPCLRITVKGPFNPGQEFDAVIDTGFSGFLAMPLVQAFPLGLILYGTTTVTLADGSSNFKLTAQAMVMGEVHAIGIAILEPSSTEILIGMEFLKTFNRVLFLHPAKPIVTLAEQSVIDLVFSPSSQQPTEDGADTQAVPDNPGDDQAST
jgi:predicted aspartyl protease